MKVLFTAVAIGNLPLEEINLLFSSADKFFLPNHEITFVLFTDSNTSLNGVKVIKIGTPEINSIWSYRFQKVLSLNNVTLDDYDYVFVNDTDQMYINPVLDSDLLVDKVCITEHFYRHLVTNNEIAKWSDVIRINGPDRQHTMSNFFGGPVKIMKNFLEYCNLFYEKYKTHNFNNTGFFCTSPEEVLLIKFLTENNIEEKRLTSQLDFTEKGFMTNINAYGNLIENLSHFKLIHNTKVNMKLAHEINNLMH